MYHYNTNPQMGTEKDGGKWCPENSYHSIQNCSQESIAQKVWLQQANIFLKGENANLKAALTDMVKRKENAEAQVVNMRGRVRQLVLSVQSPASCANSATVLFNMDFLTDLSLLHQMMTQKNTAVQFLLSDCGHLRLENARLEKKIVANQEQSTAEQSEREKNLEKTNHTLLQERLERDAVTLSLRKENDKLKAQLAQMTKIKENIEAIILNVPAQITDPSPSSSSFSVIVDMETITTPQQSNFEALEGTTGNGGGLGSDENPGCSRSTELISNNEKIPSSQMATGDTGSERPSPKALHGKGFMKGSGIFCICGRWLRNEKNLQNHIRYHSNQKRYWKCKLCGRKFAFRGHFKKHLRKTHHKYLLD